jgi:membrane protein
MAIPPTLLFLFSLVPYLPLEGIQDTLVSTVRLVIPDRSVSDPINTVLTDFLNNERGGLLSFGVLLTLFFSSNGMMGLMRSFDRALPVYRRRSGLRKRGVAIGLTLMIMLVVILMLAGLILQSEALNGLLVRVFDSPAAIRVTSLLIIVGLMFVAISAIYTYAPSFIQRFPFVSAGSVVATILCVLTTGVFFFLVSNFLQYNQVYGSIGTLIAFMVWVYLNTLVILVGYELNVSILLARHARDEKGGAVAG